ncbi:AraC family transcriptional regulator [Paracoccus beibuensis]|uniref:AraC family transcriptional regulator n=1 Tax=Paracoccus beibuensis TaxID=547602 RepID=UPI00223EC29A|nr:AraC family transcriptional regulator [Paracoccus beibuensis]
MSLWDRTGWQGGFPFSPTRLRPPARAGSPGDRAAGVTAASVPDAGSAPRPWATTDAPHGRILVPDALTVRVAPASRRMAPRRVGLRLVPLPAFGWSGAGPHAQPRTRPEHTLIWVTEGRMLLQFPRRSVLLGPGDVRYIPAGTAFAARAEAGAEGHVLMISPELTTDVDPPMPPTMIAGSIGQAGDAMLVNLRELADEAARGSAGKAFCCQLNLLSLRLSRLDPEQDHRTGKPASALDRPLVDRFLSLAAGELGAGRTLADMAQDLGTTLTHLDRACGETRGQRAIDLLNDLRLERAAELLRHTDRPTTRLAVDLGYASQTHFTRAFVAATGRTPDTYRSQVRDGSAAE